MKLGVTEYIDCAHHLPGHERCGSLHGHTYQVDVFIEGEHKGGMLLDFADIKKALRAVLADYDHKDWNTFLEYPTVENFASSSRSGSKRKSSSLPTCACGRDMGSGPRFRVPADFLSVSSSG